MNSIEVYLFLLPYPRQMPGQSLHQNMTSFFLILSIIIQQLSDQKRRTAILTEQI